MTRGRNSSGLPGFVILLSGIAILIFVEWHTDEPLVVLPVLLLVSFVAGLAMPRRFVLAGIALGWSILLAHALSDATALFVPRYQHQAPATADWVAMALLVLPAIALSLAGARSRSLVQRGNG
jgi:hypothetical protein